MRTRKLPFPHVTPESTSPPSAPASSPLTDSRGPLRLPLRGRRVVENGLNEIPLWRACYSPRNREFDALLRHAQLCRRLVRVRRLGDAYADLANLTPRHKGYVGPEGSLLYVDPGQPLISR